MSGALDQTVKNFTEQIKASEEQVLKCMEILKSENSKINNALAQLENINKNLNNLSQFTEKLLNSQQEVKIVEVEQPLEELKKLKEDFDYEYESLNDEHRIKIGNSDSWIALINVGRQSNFFKKIIDILCLYKERKISLTFKEIFKNIFNTCLANKHSANTPLDRMIELNQTELDIIKKKILTVRDIRWLLLEMEKYPNFFKFEEEDLNIMKEYNASRDNIFLVKKIMKKDGDLEDFYKDGSIKKKYTLKNGRYEGKCIEYFENGTIKGISNYKNGKREGKSESWYKNGNCETVIEFENDTLNGIYKTWHENGNTMCELYHLNGKRHGTRKDWYENGNPFELKNYIYGLQVGEYKYWNENGQLLRDAMHNNNGRLITCKEYSDLGQLLKDYNYKDGKEDGLCQEWYNNGQKKLEVNWKERKKNGERKEWNEKGELISYKIYKDNELIETIN